MLGKLLRSLFEPKRPASTGPTPGSQTRPRRASPEPSSSTDLIEQARTALHRGDLATARVALDEALRLSADSIEIGIMLATVQAQQGDLAGAARRLLALLERHPAEPDARNAMGNVLRLQGKLVDAIGQYDRALEVRPDHASALSNRALCRHDLGHFTESLQDYHRALTFDPDDLTACTNLAALEFDLGQDSAAHARIDRVLSADPRFLQARWVRAFALLRREDYEQGWPEYEWRERDAGRSSPSPELPEWQEATLSSGPLLVCAEQGLGDQIMFASCLGELAARVKEIVVECDPRLVQLFARSFPRARVYPHLKKATQPWLQEGIVPSAKTWLGSLPLRFRASRAAFPASSRYLVADAARVEAWRTRLAALGPGLRVGISWRGGTPATRSAMRSIALESWLPVLKTPGVCFVDLQYGDHAAEIDAMAQTHDIRLARWPHALSGDYDEIAALADALDLVISVQTSVVHLAGAMGKPVWVLVPRVAEWRYGASGDRMCWYPSARLFRQVDDDWSAVLAQVRAELDRFLLQ